MASNLMLDLSYRLRRTLGDPMQAPGLNLTEQVAAKTALQNAAAELAERMLPKLVN